MTPPRSYAGIPWARTSVRPLSSGTAPPARQDDLAVVGKLGEEAADAGWAALRHEGACVGPGRCLPDHILVRPPLRRRQNAGVSGVTPSSPSVSARMSRQNRRDTAPEVAVRRILHAGGLRYRVNVPVPGMPRRTIDIVFPKAKVAVFLDGCFWHGCPQHATSPKSNAEWWRTKLDKNMARDAETTEHLTHEGWTVLRFWEHEPVDDVASRIAAMVKPRREADDRS